jgi:hypothetical protein
MSSDVDLQLRMRSCLAQLCQEFADFFGGNGAARLGVANSLVNGGEGLFVLVIHSRGGLFELGFLSLGHMEMLDRNLRGSNRSWGSVRGRLVGRISANKSICFFFAPMLLCLPPFSTGAPCTDLRAMF